MNNFQDYMEEWRVWRQKERAAKQSNPLFVSLTTKLVICSALLLVVFGWLPYGLVETFSAKPWSENHSLSSKEEARLEHFLDVRVKEVEALGAGYTALMFAEDVHYLNGVQDRLHFQDPISKRIHAVRGVLGGIARDLHPAHKIDEAHERVDNIGMLAPILTPWLLLEFFLWVVKSYFVLALASLVVFAVRAYEDKELAPSFVLQHSWKELLSAALFWPAAWEDYPGMDIRRAYQHYLESRGESRDTARERSRRYEEALAHLGDVFKRPFARLWQLITEPLRRPALVPALIRSHEARRNYRAAFHVASVGSVMALVAFLTSATTRAEEKKAWQVHGFVHIVQHEAEPGELKRLRVNFRYDPGGKFFFFTEEELSEKARAGGNWLQQGWAGLRLRTEKPVPITLKVGRLFLAAGFITAAPPTMATVDYPGADPFGVLGYGVQVDTKKSDWRIVADVSGSPDLVFDASDQFDDVSASIYTSRSFKKSGISVDMSGQFISTGEARLGVGASREWKHFSAATTVYYGSDREQAVTNTTLLEGKVGKHFKPHLELEYLGDGKIHTAVGAKGSFGPVDIVADHDGERFGARAALHF